MNRIFSLMVVFILSQSELFNAQPLAGEVGEYYEYHFYDTDQSKEEVNKTDTQKASTRIVSYLRNNLANERNGKDRVVFDHVVSDSYEKSDDLINVDCDECTNESLCKTCGEARIDSTDQEITNSKEDETTENENENYIILAVDQNDDIQAMKKYFFDMIRNIAKKPNDIIASDESYSKALRSDTNYNPDETKIVLQKLLRHIAETDDAKNGIIDFTGDAIDNFQNEDLPLIFTRKQRISWSKISPDFKDRVKKTIREEQKKLLNAEKHEDEQAIRLKVIMDFLTTHMLSARYIWHELKRIEKYRVVRDKLRKIVFKMETPLYQEQHIGKNVLDCYEKHLWQIRKEMDLWRFPTNKLVQNFRMDLHEADLLH